MGVPISSLPASSTLTGTESLPVVQSGTTKKTTVADVLAALPSNAITTAKIADANVTTAKIADANVTTAKIADANVTPAKLSNSGYELGMRNRIINGNFGINQRAVTGTVTLSAGAYGHDRWKAGASGCTYTFASSGGITTLTITAGSLQQVIEDVNVPLGTNTCVMSWSGTAQGKIGAGSYSASGVTASVTGGSNLTVEFGTGTLSRVQLEQGSTPTPFEYRPYGTELALCQRYFQYCKFSLIGYATAGITFGGVANYKVTMRSAPTIIQIVNNVDFAQVNVTASTSTYLGADVGGVSVYRTATATSNTQFSEAFTASAEL